MNGECPLKICVIGCGDMGAKHGRAWHRRDDARVVAVSSPTQPRRQALAQELDAEPYADAYAAMERDGLNVVSVCTPAGHHADYACYALERGRHVLCEKPLALTLEEADRMIAASEQAGALLATSFQYRGVPRVQKFRMLYREGAFGGPLFWQYRDTREVRPKRAMHRTDGNGGVVIDMAGHHIDAFRYMTGAEPVEVMATGHVFGRTKARLKEVRPLAVDAASIQIRFEEGHCLQLLLNWGMPEGHAEQRAEYITGPELGACVEAARFEQQYTLFSGDRVETHEDAGPDHATRVDDLAEAVLGRGALEVTGRDGRIALAVSHAAVASISEQRAIPL